MKPSYWKILLLAGLLSSSLRAQTWSSEAYGFKNVHVHSDFFSLDKLYDLRVEIVFHENSERNIIVDTIVTNLFGTTLGVQIEPYNTQIAWQHPETGTVHWTAQNLLKLGGETTTIFVEPMDISGQMTVNFNPNSFIPETSNLVYDYPTVSKAFKTLHHFFLSHLVLMIFCFFLMSFHRKINRVWLFIVLLITPVLGPSIYILNRLYKSIIYFRAIFYAKKLPQTN
mgnify:CR=1 FL=1